MISSSEVCEPAWLVQSRPPVWRPEVRDTKCKKRKADDVAQIHLGASGSNGILSEINDQII